MNAVLKVLSTSASFDFLIPWIKVGGASNIEGEWVVCRQVYLYFKLLQHLCGQIWLCERSSVPRQHDFLIYMIFNVCCVHISKWSWVICNISDGCMQERARRVSWASFPSRWSCCHIVCTCCPRHGPLEASPMWKRALRRIWANLALLQYVSSQHLPDIYNRWQWGPLTTWIHYSKSTLWCCQ